MFVIHATFKCIKNHVNFSRDLFRLIRIIFSRAEKCLSTYTVLKTPTVTPNTLIIMTILLTALRSLTTPSTLILAGTFDISLVQLIAIITGVFSC